MAETFCCQICKLFQSLELRSLLNHIYTVHSQKPNFKIICDINSCTLTFIRYNTFYKHILKHHHDVYHHHGIQNNRHDSETRNGIKAIHCSNSQETVRNSVDDSNIISNDGSEQDGSATTSSDDDESSNSNKVGKNISWVFRAHKTKGNE